MKLRRTIAVFMAAVTFSVIGFNDFADRSNQAFSVNVYADSTQTITGGTVSYTVLGSNATITKFTPSSSSITSVTLPTSLGGKTVTSIDSFAFDECPNLQTVNLPSTLTSIGDSAFAYCTSLKSITVPSGVTKLGISTFMNCSSLTSVSLPEGLTGIANKAFQGCKALTSIDIPSTVTAVGNYSFKNCTSLKTMNFKGDAPRASESDPLDGCPSDMIITYLQGKSGWGSTWGGRTCRVYGGSAVESSTEATTAAVTTQATTKAPTTQTPTTQAPTVQPTTQAPTQATTKAPVTQAPTQATTKAAVTEKPTETTTSQQGGGNQSYTPAKGDADADGKLTAADSAAILQKVLNSSFKMNIENKTTNYMSYVDVDNDKKLTAADSTIVLQKVLNSSFKW